MRAKFLNYGPISDFGLQVDKLLDNQVPLPEPRPLQHGYEAISWHDTPLGQHYGLPGEGRHPASHD
jgi:hypothetical protein